MKRTTFPRHLARAAMTLLVTLLCSVTGAWAQTGEIFAGFHATGGTGGTSTEGYDKLVDGKCTSSNHSKWGTGTKGTPPNETGSYFWVDFYSDYAINVTDYILTTANDNQTYTGVDSRNPKSWILKGKLNEGDDWVVLAEVTNDNVLQDVNYTDFEYALADNVKGNYKYFRFMISELKGSSQNFMQLEELRFRGTVDEDNLATAAISGLAKRYLYTGSTIPISYTVTTYGGTVLTKGTDYTESLTRGGTAVTEVKEQGTYTLTVTGKGSYTGSTSFSFEVVDKVYIGEGTEQSYFLPVNMYYKYSLTQQIYTASEIGTAGTINSIAFDYAYTSAFSMDGVKMYIKNVDKDTFDSTTDMVPVYESDKVWEGTFAATEAGWVTIDLDTPFEYDGTSNLLMCFYYPNTGGASYIGNSYKFNTTTTSGYLALAYYSDSKVPSLEDNSNYSGYKNRFLYRANIKIDITPGAVSTCPRPTAVSASDITAGEATVTWESEGEKWNLRYMAKTATEWQTVHGLTAKTYHISGLEGNTKYSVEVQTDCGSGSTSGWKSASFTTVNPCAAPTDLAVSNITASSATLSWTAGYQETFWTVKYKAASDADFTTQTVNGSPAITLSGLAANTVYSVQVYNCTDEGSPYLSGTFTTALGIPYLEQFNTSSAPTGWSRYTGLLSGVMDGTASLTTTTSGWSFGTSCGVFDSHARVNIYGSSCKYWLVMPSVQMVNNMQLSFDVALTKYSGSGELAAPQDTGTDDKFAVLITTDGGTTWTMLRQWDNAGSEYVYNNIACSATGENVTIDLSNYAGQTVAIAFYGESTEQNADNNLHIDNVSIEYKTDCQKPNGLAVSDVENKSAVLSWESEATAWDVDVNGTVIENVTQNPYTLTGLTPETAYTVKVRAKCGPNSLSNWSNPASFTTQIACPAPTELAVTLTPGDGTVATLSWTENGEATTWKLQCGTDPEFENVPEVEVTGTPSKALTGLTPETTYYARVKAINSDGDISAWSSTVTFTPTDAYTLTVNDGTTTNSYVPIYGTWVDNITKSQFVIPAADLEAIQYGTITKLTFYANADKDWGDAEFEVYMTETTETTLSGLADYDTMEKVMNAGSLSISGNKMEVTLDAPYQYQGGNLMIGFLQTTSGTWGSCGWYGVGADSGASYGGYGTSVNAQSFLPKMTVDYTPGETPDVLRPTGLTVNYTGGTTAEVSWTSNETAFDIEVNEVVTENVTSPYTLENLELGTVYNVRVRAKNSNGDVSDWTSPVRFTTDLSDDYCQIQLVLKDSYGDGWNGNAAIKVVDVLTDTELGSYTITSAAGKNPQTFTVDVPNGRDIQFQWVSGSYDSECSYAAYDVNGDEIFSGSGTMSEAVTYTVDCMISPWRKPSDLAASEIGPHSAKLSWTENSLEPVSAWVVAYKTGEGTFIEAAAGSNPYTLTNLAAETAYTVKVRPVNSDEVIKWSNEITFTTTIAAPAPTDLSITPYPVKADVSWNGFAESYDIEWTIVPDEVPEAASSSETICVQYDNGNYVTSIGNNTSEERIWGVKYPAYKLEGNSILSKVEVYENTYFSGDYTVTIYTGGDNAPGTEVATETVTPTGSNGFHLIELSSPITIDPTQNLWITVTATGTYNMTACDVNNYDNQWWGTSGTWSNMGEDNSNLAGYGWMIRGYVEGYNPDAWAWNSETNVTSSAFTIESLQPETTYFVKVKGHFGEDGDSEWTWSGFTTPSQCDMPVDLAATDVKASSATLKWTGYQDSFEVQYRTATRYVTVWEDDFENGLDQWTIANQGDLVSGQTEGWYTVDPTSGLSFEAHSGSFAASSWSWNTTAYNANNWLITPQLDLQGVLKFYVRTNKLYPDSYEVLLSTTGTTISTIDTETQEVTDPGDFTITLQAMAEAPATGDWAEVVIDLSQYAGQQGYIAIHHVDNDMNYLLIDDLGIYTVEEAGNWTTVTTTDQSVSIANLDADSEYEWQVRGVSESCEGGYTEWSEMATFTTTDVLNGDANGDGEVNIADVTAIINYINGNPPAGFNFDAANANGDENIDIADVTAVINIINKQ